MNNSTFPYGNSLADPAAWAGLRNAKSKTWLVGYLSGFSFIIGKETFLLLGRESLSAAVISFVGAGPSIGIGLAAPMKKIARSGGRSPRSPNKSDSSNPVEGAAEQYEKYEKADDIKKVQETVQAGNELNSGTEVYEYLKSNGTYFESIWPFSLDELDGKQGVVRGVDVDYRVGSASAYSISANGLFMSQSVYNHAKEPTLVGASIGELLGIWTVGKYYNLFLDITKSSHDEYPFRNYDVNTYFRDWRSNSYEDLQKYIRIQKQDEIISNIKNNIKNNPEKYGFSNKIEALRRIQERNQEQDEVRSGKLPAGSNPWLPWVPARDRYLFD